MRTIHSVILAVGIALAGIPLGIALVKFKRLDHYVEVRGFNEQIVKSDTATWTLSYADAAEQIPALNALTKKDEDNIVSFLKDSGFADDEITRNPATVSDRLVDSYNNNTKSPRYRANGSVSLRTSKVDQVTKAAQSMEQLVAKGTVVTSSSLRYYFTGLSDIKPAMLKEATANAKAAAKTFAEDSGQKVGRMRSASQGLFNIGSAIEDYDSGQSIMKKVRVVTTAQYFLE